MRQQAILAPLLLSFALITTPATSATLELALVIDGSGSISSDDWTLQVGAYQSVFQDNFYSNFVGPGRFDQVAVAAYVFSGANLSSTEVPEQFRGIFSVLGYIPWTLITSDQDAANFGAQFPSLIQPDGATATSEALRIATDGGQIGCPLGLNLNDTMKGTTFTCTGTSQAPGLTSNAFDGDELVIDISTDGVPYLPGRDETALANAQADQTRSAGIVINAIGVDFPNLAVLDSLVGIDPASDPQGFVVSATDFSEFQATLNEKLRAELGVIPLPGTLPLFLSAIGGLAFWRRRSA